MIDKKSNACTSNSCRFTNSLLIKKKTTIFHRVYYYLISIPIIYRYKVKLKYVSLGLFGEIVDFTLLFVLTSFLNVFYLLSAIIAYLSGMIANFFLHKNITFKYHTNNFWKSLASFFRYSMISISGLIITLILMSIFVELLGIHYLLAKLIAGIIVFFINYSGHSSVLSPKLGVVN